MGFIMPWHDDEASVTQPEDSASARRPKAGGDIDWSASPTLTSIRLAAGEDAARRLVAARGGTSIYLPETVTPECILASIVGMDAAQKIVDCMGSHRTIDVPTGRGHKHGRRLDHAEAQRLWGAGLSASEIAGQLGCTERQVYNIVSGAGPNLRSGGHRRPRQSGPCDGR